MKHLIRQMSGLTVLVTIVFCLTSSSIPGYDENGNDIDECQLYAPCPDGYLCLNIQGSYLCEALPGVDEETGPKLNLHLDNSSSGLFYRVEARCTSLGNCTAICNRCYKSYSYPTIGRAHSISGFCVCGSLSFKGM
nr:calcium-binding EGF-like domain-containing protein [Odoribacter splanchnicus]